MRRLLIAVVVFVSVPAVAQARWTTFEVAKNASDYSPIVGSDGDRWAVSAGNGSSVRVFDDRHPERGWREVAYDPGCVRTTAVAHGEMALLCSTDNGPGYPHVLDLATGRITRVPGAVPDPYDVSIEPFAIGRKWVAVYQRSYHVFLVRYLSRTDGHLVDVDAPRRAPDLDASDVGRPLCSPVRRPAATALYDLVQPRYEQVQQTGRWTVFADGREGDITALKAWRCGKRKPRRLFRCDNDCDTLFGSIQTGAGVVTALREDRTVKVIRLDAHRRSTVTIPPLTDAPAASTVVHTKHFLIAANAELGRVAVAYRRLPR